MTVQPLLFEALGVKPLKATKPKKRRRPKPTVAEDAPVAYAHSIDAEGRAVWTLRFPAPAAMISVNGNPHWRRTSPARKAFREAMFVHAKAATLPVGLARVRVDIDLGFPTGGRRDASNYFSHVAKPIVDAIGPAIDTVRAGKRIQAVGYGLIADDTAEFLDGPFLRLGSSGRRPGAPFGEVVVTITDLSAVAA